MKFFKTAESTKREDINNFLAGAGAGAGSALIMNPLDVWNTKKKHIAGKTGKDLEKAEKELAEYKKNLFKRGPIKGVSTALTGYGSKALKVGGASAISFLLYNKLKQNLDDKNTK